MASGGDDSNVALWSMSDGSQQALMSGHDGWVYSVSWSPNSCVLVSGGRDMSVRLWDVTTEESLLHSLEVYEHRKQHLDDHVLDFESTSVPAEANSVSVDDSSASSFLFGLGRKTLGTVTKTLGAVSFQLEDGRNALGAVTKKLGAVTDKLDDMFDDTMHMLGAKLGNRLDIIAELSETAHQKFEEAKFLAKNKATAAANKIQSAAANALDTLDDLMDHLEATTRIDFDGDGQVGLFYMSFACAFLGALASACPFVSAGPSSCMRHMSRRIHACMPLMSLNPGTHKLRSGAAR